MKSWSRLLIVFPVAVILISVFTLATTQTTSHRDASFPQEAQPTIKISAILFDGYQYNDQDEAIELTNITENDAELAGWEICKSSSGTLYCTALPEYTIKPGNSLWLARNVQAFTTTFGFQPDLVLSPWRTLANEGGILYLRDPDANFVDTLVYGNVTETAIGWSGKSVNSYYNYLRGTTGQILTRISDEDSGLPVADTDTIQDWMQNTDNPLTGRRVWYPGWTKNPLFWPMQSVEDATIIIGIAPDNAFEVVAETILKAKNAISIEMYTFDNAHLLPVLLQKGNEGVTIRVLLEGNPVGLGELSPEWQTQLYICSEIEAVGGECWFMMHDPDEYIYNRYEYLHSKMMIIDDKWVVIGSQNFTSDSLPADDKLNGTLGSRGSIIATNASSVITRAQQVFALDFDHASHNDLIRWNTGNFSRYIGYHSDKIDITLTDEVSYTVQYSQPFKIEGNFHFELFTAPEAALRRSDTLLYLLEQAGTGDRILVELMYEYAAWGPDSNVAPNLRLEGYIDAARRGAAVRILLNGKGYGHNNNQIPEENILTLNYVQNIARLEQLNLQIALGNPSGGGIHNKMILVKLHDSTAYSHIGSINGSESANKVNREIALQIASEPVYQYLEGLFEFDWWMSHPVFLPVVSRNMTNPNPPVDHLVISEVFYNPNPAMEWVELYNPTADEISLSTFKLGDAELPTSYESMFQFPISSTIRAYGTIVVAVNGSMVPQADYEFYESDPTVQNMVPDLSWGSQNYPFSLRDAGDQVLLLDEQHAPIDSLVWGDAILTGIVPHPGKLMTSASLERYPPYDDTDNCLVDFRERYPPTPGEVPTP